MMRTLILISLLVVLAAVGHAQVPLAQQSTAALQDRYEALQTAFEQTNDLVQLDAILAEQTPIGDELTRRDVAQIHATSAALETGIVLFAQHQDVTDKAAARAKWCHQTPWRLIRRYHEPQWCRE
jgi:cell division protein FtsB